MKKGLRIIVTICLIMLTPINVLAKVDNEATFDIATNAIPDWPKGPKIKANTGVLIEMETAEVLYDKGMNEARYPASITKVLTALVAIENSTADEEVVFTASALEGMYLGANIGMQEGEILTMEQCLIILIMKSANEVANQIAEHIGGSKEGFAKMMNDKAVEIGCQNSNFTNPSGMPDENHYSTAYDMALIFREAWNNERFRALYDISDYTIPPTNKNPESRYILYNHLLFAAQASEEQRYEGSVGGKTGATDLGGSTLVTAVKRKKGNFIAVVMRAGDHLICCADTKKLFNYGYKKFQKINAEEGPLVAPKDFQEANLEIQVTDIDGSDMVAKTYSYNGYLLGTMEGERPEATEAPATPTVMMEEANAVNDQNNSAVVTPVPEIENISTASSPLRKVIAVLVVLVVVGLVFIIIGMIKNKKRKK